jgi:hypothetical protein
MTDEKIEDRERDKNTKEAIREILELLGVSPKF